MKKIIIIMCLTVLYTNIFTQQAPPGVGRIKELTRRLDLNDSQVKKITAIMEKSHKKLIDRFDQHKNNGNVNDERKFIDEIINNENSEIEKVLNSNQKKEFKKFREEMKNERKKNKPPRDMGRDDKIPPPPRDAEK